MASGLLLALANTIVIALGLAIAVPSRDVTGAIVVIGLLPAFLIGGLTGGIATLTDRSPKWVRLCLMAPIPLTFVFVGASGLRLGPAGEAAMIPTLVAVLLLERWSRRPEEAQLPLARSTLRGSRFL